MEHYPSRPCCTAFEKLRLKLLVEIKVLRSLGILGNPRIVVLFYEVISTRIPSELLERLLDPDGGCPCGARAGEDVRDQVPARCPEKSKEISQWLGLK